MDTDDRLWKSLGCQRRLLKIRSTSDLPRDCKLDDPRPTMYWKDLQIARPSTTLVDIYCCG